MLLFAESNTRFLCEVAPDSASKFEQALAGVPLARLGEVVDQQRLHIAHKGRVLVDADVPALKHAWQARFDW